MSRVDIQVVMELKDVAEVEENLFAATDVNVSLHLFDYFKSATDVNVSLHLFDYFKSATYVNVSLHFFDYFKFYFWEF